MIFERSKFPELPGVYIMKDKEGAVIYVGKATSLRARLSQYFGSESNPAGSATKNSLKTSLLVPQIDSIEFIVTKDPKEALILESNLIKNYMPKYNMALKDAKHYSYLAITEEPFPRLLTARKNSKGAFRMKNARFFGPYVEGAKRAMSARYLRKLFKIRICAPKLPKKECLQYHIGNCDAPCIGRISEENYRRNISALISVLEGKQAAKDIMRTLAERMRQASDTQDFETAASIRDQIGSLEIFFERQRVEKRNYFQEDFVYLERIGATLHAQILRSNNGVISGSERHGIPIKEQEEPEISFFIQYYVGSELPDRIYSNLSEQQIQILNQAFDSKSFHAPGRDKSKVLEIAKNSLQIGSIDSSVIKLKEALKLETNPITIETFDISNLFGEESVGSMVRFVNGKPDKNNYRRFKIRTVAGQDDFAMMKEVVSRRYTRLMEEAEPLPDLVLIDGGAGQLHAAMDGMDEAGVRLPIASLAKKEEEIYLPERLDTLRLSKSDPALKLLMACRDEAHRFAIGFHRLRRAKKMKG